jgi:transposase InsO family protein
MIDLFSRRVIGWPLHGRQAAGIALQALLMAVWRRRPKNMVLVRSDQGSQFTSMDRAVFLKHHSLEHSMSRRGNCHGNAMAESFFTLLKREHLRDGMRSPVKFERQQEMQPEDVHETRGYSASIKKGGPVRGLLENVGIFAVPA